MTQLPERTSDPTFLRSLAKWMMLHGIGSQTDHERLVEIGDSLDADNDMDVANITLVRVGGRIKIFSKGDGAFGECADELVKSLAGMFQRSGLWEVDGVGQTRDPYAGTDETPEDLPTPPAKEG